MPDKDQSSKSHKKPFGKLKKQAAYGGVALTLNFSVKEGL